jgi:hypothetical protein
MLSIGREACRREDAVFSRKSNCVGTSFIVLRGLFESASVEFVNLSVAVLLA